MDANDKFIDMSRQRVKTYSENQNLNSAAQKFMNESLQAKYSYNFFWLGRPIIQYPQDLMALQEIIWETKPELIIETGVAHGGSLLFYASMLELIGNGSVLGIDVDIRSHNKTAILDHPLSKRIELLEGSSTSKNVLDKVAELTKNKNRVMVSLDSNHTHEHVLNELNLYSPFVTVGNYLVVFDTVIEKVSKDLYADRPWGPGNNPYTAVNEFIKINDGFVVDLDLEQKIQITVSPSGYLKRVKK